MKKKRLLLVLGVLMLLLYACVKDEWFLEQNQESSDNLSNSKNRELTIAAAKSWYLSHEMPVTRMSTTKKNKFGFLVAPSWNHAKEWKKGDYEIVEASLLANTEVHFYDKETYEQKESMSNEEKKRLMNVGRTVILKNLTTGEIITFNMIIVGSRDYLRNPDNKLSDNNYLYREPHFDGMILFFAPDGEFVNGWKYQKGKIIKRLSPALESNEDSEDFSPISTRTEQECQTTFYFITYFECPDDSEVKVTNEFGGTIAGGGTIGEVGVTASRCNEESELVTYIECKTTNDPDDGKYDGDGGGGSGPSGSLSKKIIKNTDKLTEEQKKKLDRAIEEMRSKMCYANAILNFLESKGVSFGSVSIDSSLGGNGANLIFPDGRIDLAFGSEDDINFEVFAHELVHRLQEYLESYSGLDSRGMMEYEEAFINDIMFFAKYKGDIPSVAWYDREASLASGTMPESNQGEQAMDEWNKTDADYRSWLIKTTKSGIPTSISTADFQKWVVPFSKFNRPYTTERGYKYNNKETYTPNTLGRVLELGIEANC